MYKRFRLSAVLSLLALVSMLLTACGGDAATSTAVPVAATATSAVVAPTATSAAGAPTATMAATMAAPTATTAMAATATTGTGTGTTNLQVGLVTDVGSINDKSFNQGSWEGVQAAGKALGFTPKYIETKDPKDYQANIEQLISEGANVIVTVGFAIGEATIASAQAHPDVKFIGVDQFQAATVDNLSGVIFEEDKSGFLAGALAAQMTKSGKIGAVLATDTVPPVWRFGEGFKAGANYIKQGIEIQAVYHSDVDLSKTFNDPAWGKTTANSMIDKGVDVIFSAGGNTGNGGLAACAERSVMCIGVDVDQYNTVPEAQKALLSSATKDLSGGVTSVIEAIADGSFVGGNFTGPVALAPFHDFDSQVSQAVKDKLAQITADLASGTLKTNVAPVKPTGDTPAATATVAPAAGATELTVGLVTDVGSINDKSFNQGSWEGVQAAGKSLGFTPKYIETKDPKDYQANIEQLISEGANVIVTVGFAIGEATIASAQAHPDVKFIGVDQFQAATVDNLSGVVFEEDKSGFLAGALAAQMTKSGKIGAVLATDTVPPVWRFGEGFKAGANYIKQGIEIQAVYHSDVDLSKTFNDPAWGKTTANSMIDKGVDVIFSAGGNTGNGGLAACAERSVMCIGVDVDQYNTVPEAQKALLSSATKDLSGGVTSVIEAIADGSFVGGNFTGPVALAPFHDFDSQVSQAVKDKLAQITTDLASGTLKTNVAPVKP